ncbi:DUF488 domain-containing protein (plasmid) [Streptomyces sp. CA-294286]|uniref:DUF488 domain-containing protein n=1 Tax=Streptomyces sp. CA-294286 TaxID=3240070 RepID=UPI003D927805
MASGPDVRVRRVYDPPEPSDGCRVLVDRLWPRGVSRERAGVDEWLKDVAPSSALRAALHGGELDFPDFRRRYRTELAEPGRAAAVDRLRDLARTSAVTLVTSVRDPDRSHVGVLVAELTGR